MGENVPVDERKISVLFNNRKSAAHQCSQIHRSQISRSKPFRKRQLKSKCWLQGLEPKPETTPPLKNNSLHRKRRRPLITFTNGRGPRTRTGDADRGRGPARMEVIEQHFLIFMDEPSAGVLTARPLALVAEWLSEQHKTCMTGVRFPPGADYKSCWSSLKC